MCLVKLYEVLWDIEQIVQYCYKQECYRFTGAAIKKGKGNQSFEHVPLNNK